LSALKEQFEKARERVKKARIKYFHQLNIYTFWQRHEEEKEELANLSQKDLEALKNIKIYKFYPTHDTIPIEQHMVSLFKRLYMQLE
jgi:hypothetical protein